MALGHKDLGTEISLKEIRDISRTDAECDLIFDGFIAECNASNKHQIIHTVSSAENDLDIGLQLSPMC